MGNIKKRKIGISFILGTFLLPYSLFAQVDTLVKGSPDEINTGYKWQGTRDFTGSVSVISRSGIVKIPSGNITNQLQGLASGVNVIGNGQPGSVGMVTIRGIGTFSGIDPLYVVDGITTRDVSFLNSNDIESVAILRDAGASAIYGTMGLNGAVVITTRRGTRGIHLNYDMSIGTQLPGKGPTGSLLNTQEYGNLQWLVYHNDGVTTVNPVYGSSLNAQPTIPDWAANTDWYAAITNKAGMQNHNLSFHGGGKHGNFYVGFGYLMQNGIIIHNYDKRYTAKVNSDFSFLNNHITFGENFGLAMQSNPQVPNLSELSPIHHGPYGIQSIIPVFITSPITGTTHNFVPGEYGGTGISAGLGSASNPVASLDRARNNVRDSYYLNGNIYTDIKIVDGLTLKSSYGDSWRKNYGLTFNLRSYESADNGGTSSATDETSFRNDWIWTNLLMFSKTLKNQKFSILAGYEMAKFDQITDRITQRYGDFSTTAEYDELINTLQILNQSSLTSAPYTMVSQFLYADYSHSDRYLLGFTLRRDGISPKAEGSKYNLFPAVSLGWRLSNEAFLKDINWLNEAKIRLSYGKTGSLVGETGLTTDIGLDAEILDRSIGMQFDWYARNSENVLFQPTIPGTAGQINPPEINSANITNYGIDLVLTYRKSWRDLGFNGSVVFTTYKNRIYEIGTGVTFFDYASSRIGSLSRNMVGSPIAVFYGYKVIGLFKDATDVNNSPEQDGAAPGFFKFANTDQTTIDPSNNRQVIDPKDRTIIGNPNPKYTFAINLDFTFKRFDLSALVYSSQGNDIYNFNKWWTDFWPSFRGQKSKDLLYNSWTPDNTDATVPKASNTSNFSTNTQSTSYYIEDGSYLRLKSLQLGYSIPSEVTTKIHIQSLRIYFQAVNLFTLTKYSGIDPEIGGSSSGFGIDFGNYPKVKQLIFGLQLSL